MSRLCVGKSGQSVTGIGVLMALFVLMTTGLAPAEELKTINLPAVSKDRGSSVMTALSNKASADSLSDKDLSLQDLSDLLWAAAGINRPDNKKRTFSTAMNTQDVDVYVLMKAGAYLYDYETHALNPVASGDFRSDIMMKMGGGAGATGAGGPGPSGSPQAGSAPTGEGAGGPPAGTAARKRLSTFAVDLILVGEPSKYRAGSDDLKAEWSAFSAGMIAQNVMLFCTANNMGTRPRAAFDKANIKSILKLRDSQNPVIELPVGYPE